MREVLGEHVEQKGSLVESSRLRFDFSHYSAITPEELQQIESLVNAQVRGNADAETPTRQGNSGNDDTTTTATATAMTW